MRCSSCGAENPEGLKFCNECAAPFKRRCVKCGFENAPTARFCGECAAALSESASHLRPLPESATKDRTTIRVESDIPADGERKTVTALFADIKGSTELMEDLDPEEARAIIDPALKLMIEAVRRYDGYVVQSTGDGIFALFGAPVAHEDHPQRALYAALRLQDATRAYSAKLVADGGTPLEARVGINTGEVVVRTLTTADGHTEYTPIGHTANLASRMQATAPTGSIALTEHTCRLVEGYFQLKARGPARVKGLNEPVNVYEVTGLGPLRTRLQRAVGRGLTKFVGREREIEALRHAADQAKSGHGQIVAAMAEPGVGKSRLFYEFKATSQSGWMALETFSSSHGKASAYLPVLDLLHGYFKIAGGDDERTRREKVAGRLAMLDPSLEGTRPYLFSLLGIVEGADPLAQMDGHLKKRRTLEAIKRILLRESLNQPLLMIVEDLHWIDEATQEFLNLLADSLGTAKLLLLLNYRPEYSHKWNSKTYYTQLRLDPLGKESADEMLTAMLGDGKDLLLLRRLIIERTEGNPFFMEEIVQVLLDEGALVRDGAGVRLTKPLNALKIPPTVQGILAARIDRLAPENKALLQTLAVIGKEFTLNQVNAVLAGSDSELDQRLEALQSAEFIYEQPTTGDIEYTFKHALTQELAYQSLLIERRKQVHERAGQALESMYGDQLEDHLSELAHHYSRSGNTHKAIEYLHKVGQQMMQRSAYTEAISHLSAALALLMKLPDTRDRVQQELTLQIVLGAPLIASKGYGAPEVRHAYARAHELAEQLGETSQLFPVLLGLFLVNALRGEYKAALKLGGELLTLGRNTQEPTLRLTAHYMLGATFFLQGQAALSQSHLEQGRILYKPEQHQALTSIAGFDVGTCSLCWLSGALWHLGKPSQALQLIQEAVSLAEKLAHPFNLVTVLGFAAWLHSLRREVKPALAYAERQIEISTEKGIKFNLAWGMIVRGWALAEQDAVEEGIAQLRKGIADFQETGGNQQMTYSLALLTEAYTRKGCPAEALAILTAALAMAGQSGELYYHAELHRLKGELMLKELCRPTAESQLQAEMAFKQAIKIAREQSAKSLELRATVSLARLLRDSGRRDEARSILTDIYNWFTEGFDTADLKDAKALLGELGGTGE
jgi:class 3 adenylate cyclase/predicted ATPase